MVYKRASYSGLLVHNLHVAHNPQTTSAVEEKEIDVDSVLFVQVEKDAGKKQ